MTGILHLDGAGWISDPDVVTVIDALAAAGGEDCVRFVGGCVRNAIMGRPITDIDLATTVEPDRVTAALEAAGLRAVPTGIDHGTITAIRQGRSFEITTLRRDVRTDGRHAVVAFTRDWVEDAQRRDFTLNALYADRKGQVFDPTGQGLTAARTGRIVFVGDAAQRIREDHLRILRYFRFLAHYGRGEPDPVALAACRSQASSLEGLAAERILKELLSLLAADDPRAAIRLMSRTGVLARVLPAAGDLTRLEGLIEVEAEEGSPPDPLLRLGALFPETPVGVAREAERLRLSGAQRDRLIAAAGREPRLISWMSPRQLRRALHLLGPQAAGDRVLMAWARTPHGPAAQDWRDHLAGCRDWAPRRLPISGDDVVAAGAAPGPRVGEILRELEIWWMDEDFPDDPQALRGQLAAIVRGLEL